MNNPVDKPKVGELDAAAFEAAQKEAKTWGHAVGGPALPAILRAYLAALTPQATTVGVTVPREPTREMLEAGREIANSPSPDAWPQFLARIYGAMIEAAPALIGIPGAEKGEAVPDDDWQALMDLASKLRVKATARYADDIAQVETMEERAHAIAKASGDLGYLS